MNGLALCSGYGGLEIALELVMADYHTVCYVERETYPVALTIDKMEKDILVKAPIWDDLTTFNGLPWRGKVHIITAGFPCQPFSVAGQRRGAQDERFIWPHIIRIIREVRSGLVFLENVPGLSYSRKDKKVVVNPAVMGRILGDLAEAGFDAEWGVFAAGLRIRHDKKRGIAWRIRRFFGLVPTDVGASHLRERLFILAYRIGRRSQNGRPDSLSEIWKRRNADNRSEIEKSSSELADSERGRRQARGTDARWQEGDSVRDKGATMADAADYNRGARSEGEQKEKRSGRGRFADDNTKLADAKSERPREKRRLHAESPERITGSGKAMVNAKLPRQRQIPERAEEERTNPTVSSGLPAFPPRPHRLDQWRKILESRPDLAPAVESDFCRMANGSTVRVDRLRCLGNGVVPLQAAYAFVTLARRLN